MSKAGREGSSRCSEPHEPIEVKLHWILRARHSRQVFARSCAICEKQFMSATTEKVFVEALSLPMRERAALVYKLLISLQPEEGSPEIEAAWAEEALDRAMASDAGEIQERDAADVMRDADRKLQ
jgi:putative addiction module component